LSDVADLLTRGAAFGVFQRLAQAGLGFIQPAQVDECDTLAAKRARFRLRHHPWAGGKGTVAELKLLLRILLENRRLAKGLRLVGFQAQAAIEVPLDI